MVKPFTIHFLYFYEGKIKRLKNKRLNQFKKSLRNFSFIQYCLFRNNKKWTLALSQCFEFLPSLASLPLLSVIYVIINLNTIFKAHLIYSAFVERHWNSISLSSPLSLFHKWKKHPFELNKRNWSYKLNKKWIFYN